MIRQDIKETKRYGHMFGRSNGLSDNVKTVYPPTNTVCGGYNETLAGGIMKHYHPDPGIKPKEYKNLT